MWKPQGVSFVPVDVQANPFLIFNTMEPKRLQISGVSEIIHGI